MDNDKKEIRKCHHISFKWCLEAISTVKYRHSDTEEKKQPEIECDLTSYVSNIVTYNVLTF